MPQRWIPAAAMILFLCFPHFVFAHEEQDHESKRDGEVSRIQEVIREHNLAEAKRLLAEARKEYPADAGVDNLLGIVEAQQGNYAKAEISFSRAIQRKPTFTGAYLNLGRLYQEHAAADPQAPQKAIDVYERVLQYEPANAEAHYQSALLLMQQAKYQRSLDHLSHLPQKAQDSAQVLSIVCADYGGLGSGHRAEDAVARLTAAIDFSEPDAEQALPGLRAGKRDDLIVSLLEKLQNRQSLSPALLHALAAAYERTNKLVEARVTFEKCFAAEDASVDLLLDLARVAQKQKDYRGALGYLAHARDLEPNKARLYYYFGVVCINLNLLAEAQSSFEKAVKLEPENPDYVYAMGAASAFRQDPAEAVPYFEKFLKLRPQDPRGKLAMGAALFRAKDYDAAIPWLKQSAAIPETSARAHYYLGVIALQEGQLDEASLQLQKALKGKPDYADALAELGQYYLSRKDYEHAEQQIGHALRIEPDHYEANFYLLTLYTRTKDKRQEAQAKRFEELKKLLADKSQEFLRIVEVRPFQTP